MKRWKEKCLSRAGKETLIKSIAQAIPNYIMSCYKLPESCCKDIETMLSKFWWKYEEGARKLHWLSWNNLAKNEKNGGMGFREFSEFNKALLGKHCWRLLTKEGPLLEQIYKSRYYPRNNSLDVGAGYQPSYAWRSMLSAREVVLKGGRWQIGNGRKVKIWGDNWIPIQSDFKVYSPSRILEPDALVAELLDDDLKHWNEDLVLNCFSSYEAHQILSIPISFHFPIDNFIWHWEKDGKYSVRSAYRVLCDANCRSAGGSSHSDFEKLWNVIWKAPVPNKIRDFLWRLARNILPSRCNLKKKGIQLDTIFPLCNDGDDNAHHLVMHCNFMKLALFSSQISTHIPLHLHHHEWLFH